VTLRRLRAELAHRFAGGLALLVLVVAVVWVLGRAVGLFGASANLPLFIVVTLNGLTLAGLYFIVASGFTLIFGLMRVVNMAHGSLYLLGGYIGLRLVHNRVNYWPALVLAALAIGVIGLVMQQLMYSDEVRPFSEVELPQGEVKPAELELAKQIIEQIAENDFKPEKYEDDVKKRIQEQIQRKVEGQEIDLTPAEQPKTQVIDLMEALKASLAARGEKASEPVGEDRKPARRAPRAEKAAKASRK